MKVLKVGLWILILWVVMRFVGLAPLGILGDVVIAPFSFAFSHIVSLLVFVGVIMLFLHLIGCLSGKSCEKPKRHERHESREEESATIRRQREKMEKMARRIESLETILTDEAPPRS